MSHFDNPTFTNWTKAAVRAANAEPSAQMRKAAHVGIALTVIARGEACFADRATQRKLATLCEINADAFAIAAELTDKAKADAQTGEVA